MTNLESSIQLEPARICVSLATGAGIAEEEAVGWTGPERRREHRYVTCDPVNVVLLDCMGLRVSGVLRDVSKSGFRVEIDLPVQKGARLKLTLHNQIIFAGARYCRKTADTYQVGASIEWIYLSRRGPSDVPQAAASKITRANSKQPGA